MLIRLYNTRERVLGTFYIFSYIVREDDAYLGSKFRCRFPVWNFGRYTRTETPVVSIPFFHPSVFGAINRRFAYIRVLIYSYILPCIILRASDEYMRIIKRKQNKIKNDYDSEKHTRKGVRPRNPTFGKHADAVCFNAEFEWK